MAVLPTNRSATTSTVAEHVSDHNILAAFNNDHPIAVDPHTVYILKSLVDAAGDLIIGTADNTVGRLAKGSAMNILRVNAGGTALEWAVLTDYDPSGTMAAHVAAADPHPGYVLESLVDTAGDLIVGTADNTVGRLAKGSALNVLRVNSGGTALEWATIASGGGVDLTSAQTITGLKTFTPSTASAIGMIVKGLAAQTGSLQQWQDSTGAILSQINSAGNLHIGFVYNMTGTRGIQTTASPGMTVFGGAADVILVVKGAASQTGNLQEWEDSTGTALCRITPTGNFAISTAILNNSGTRSLTMGATSGTTFSSTAAADKILILKGAAAQSGSLQEWQDSAGAVQAQMTASGSLILKAGEQLTATFISGYTATNPYFNLGASILLINRTTASNVPFIIKGMAAQTGDLQQWQDSTGAVLASLSSIGIFTCAGIDGGGA